MTNFGPDDTKRVAHTLDYWVGLLGAIPDDAAMTVIKPGIAAFTEQERFAALLLLLKATAATRKSVKEAVPGLVSLAKETGMTEEEVELFEQIFKGLLA